MLPVVFPSSDDASEKFSLERPAKGLTATNRDKGQIGGMRFKATSAGSLNSEPVAALALSASCIFIGVVMESFVLFGLG